MTSDAKVGLLLGLVFIFIIAFIINGLPNFYRTTNSNELTTNMIDSQRQQLGIASNERKVYREVIDRTQFIKPIPVETKAVDDQTVRFTTALPKAASAQQAKGVNPSAILSPANSKRSPVSARTMLKNWPKVYVVSKGDSLALIAKKVYGPEEGNRKANIEKIFAANKNLLKSIDRVYVGQELIIPSLSGSGSAGPKEPGHVSMLEKVKSIGQRRLSGSGGSNRHSQYVVCEGDSLWRIAASKLGNGSRYSEIAKLNVRVLGNIDSLDVGMRLNLPIR